jgi:hypothetical protein
MKELGRDQALRQIASEKDLEIFERLTLENPIAHIFSKSISSTPKPRYVWLNQRNRI